MSSGETRFHYVARDQSGAKVRGEMAGASAEAVFSRLRSGGLMPLKVQPLKVTTRPTLAAARLGDRDLAAFLSNLSALLAAGADIRSCLAIIGGKGASAALQRVSRETARAVSGGDSLEQAVSRWLTGGQTFVAALIAAGDSASDLPGALERGAEILRGRIALRDQLVSVLSYPAFVFVTAIAAFLVILTLVIPSIAPLAETPGAHPSLALRLMLALSEGLRSHAWILLALILVFVASLVAAAVTGRLVLWLDRLAMDGPARRTAAQIAYGGYAIALGGILAAGAPMSEALRLALRGVRSQTARERLSNVAGTVRQGEALADVLGRVPYFPEPIIQMALIGQEAGQLGQMLLRSGRLEEQAALQRIEAVSRLIGPALIVGLGALIGLMMAGLLSGVSGLGEAALG